jgi:hypothetical protein
MFRLLGLILVVLINRVVVGQINLFDYDTLKYNHVILGSLDTIDQASRPLSSSFLFPNESVNTYWIQPNQLFHQGNSIYSISHTTSEKLKFSALPHIGFGYSFGAQATQKLDFEFHQAFKQGFLINALMHNFKTDGFFRNTNAQNSQYELDLARNGKVHSFQLKVRSIKVQRNWSGGIQNDSLLETLSTKLIPVLKENAQSINKNLIIELTNKFLILKDSSNLFGISTTNEYRLFKRFYTERDSISSLYSIINLDSLKTNDSLLQHSSINHVGLFFKSNRLNLEGGINSSYWKYSSFGYQNDTLEVGLYSQVKLRLGDFSLDQKGNYNLSGAANGFQNLIQLDGKLANFKLSVVHKITNELPLVFQRFFYSNNVAYKTINLEKQLFQNFTLKLGRNFQKQNFQFTYELGQFNKIYQFDSQQLIWRNDLNSSNGIYNQFSLKSHINWNWFNLHLKYQYTAIDETKRFVPPHAFDTRLFASGGIFKAKKLKAAVGMDFIITSSYRRLNFIPQMTIFDLENSSFNSISNGFMNLAAFASFEVEAFRLFIRLDNIAYFWQDRQIEIVNGYAFPSAQFKVGITWDFWN